MLAPVQPVPWHPEDIRCALRKLGYTQDMISKELKVSRSTVAMTIRAGTSKVVRAWIAHKLSVDESSIWPFKFPVGPFIANP